jgi:hypothetical protein
MFFPTFTERLMHYLWTILIVTHRGIGKVLENAAASLPKVPR